MKWLTAVTTHPKRRNDLLPQTLASIEAAGFDKPRLFVDDCDGATADSYRAEFGLEATNRWPLVRTCLNGHLALLEMFLRDPDADRYALFQDDVVFPKNLRPYLEHWYPEKGYMNLFTFNSNLIHLRARFGLKDTQEPPRGWHTSHQFGRGALGLVFSNEGLQALLTAKHMLKRQADPAPESRQRRWRQFDGAVVTSMNEQGWQEFVHYPSLCYHTGTQSVMEKRKPIEHHDPNHPVYTWPDHNPPHFPGTDFDCLTWLEGNGNVSLPERT